MPAPAAVHTNRVAARRFALGVQGMTGLRRRLTGDHRLHRHRLHHQALALHQKRKALAIGLFEGGLNRKRIAERHHQRRVGALVAHMGAAMHQEPRLAALLAAQLGLSLQRQRLQLCGQLRQGLLTEWQLHRLLADQVLIGQAHAIGREHASQRMHQHPAHAQCVGHQAGMLAARAAKALQGVARHVIAASDRDFLDRVGHLLHRNADKAFGHLLGAAASLQGEHLKLLSHRLGAQGLVGLRAKHFWEIGWLDFAQHHIRIGYSQRTAAPIAGRPRVGASALRPDPKAGAVKSQDGAATGSHGVYAHHRRAHAHTRDLGFKLALELTGKVRHVGRGAAHVEADHLVAAGELSGTGHAHDAAGRTGQDGVLAGKSLRIGQAARGLHEKQLDAGHLGSDLVHIAPQNR